ncbi:hypothetical protein MVT41_24495, partial [Salmonella sp. 14ESS1282]|nr:hypothetical protein [Salmonella sp. 14ESS1282]
ADNAENPDETGHDDQDTVLGAGAAWGHYLIVKLWIGADRAKVASFDQLQFSRFPECLVNLNKCLISVFSVDNSGKMPVTSGQNSDVAVAQNGPCTHLPRRRQEVRMRKIH